MTTNLKIKLEGNTHAILTEYPGSYGAKSILNFYLCFDLEAWNNGVAENENGRVDLTTAGPGTGFPIKDKTPDNNLTANSIKYVKIVGPTITLTIIRNLVCLKHEINKQNKSLDSLNFELIIDKNLGNQDDYWEIVNDMDDPDNKILYLEAADFGGVLDTSKISINDTFYHDREENEIETLNDYDCQKQELLELDNLIKNTLHPKFYKIDYESGDDLIDLSDVLGVPPDLTKGNPATGLWAYFHGKTPWGDNINKEPENIKHTLFDLEHYDNNGDAYMTYGYWINYTILLELARKNLGITKKSQWAIFKENYHDLNNIDKQELLKEPGFYKGFPLLDPNLTSRFDSANKEWKIYITDSNKPVRYTQINIDNFRDFATPTANNNYTGPNHDIFTKETTINGVQVFANRLPEECLGFQPGDIEYDTEDYVYVNGGMLFAGYSKISCDIWEAQNAEEAMDLAFYGKDYDEPQSNNANRKGNPNQRLEDYKIYKKHPNVNLQFNEVKGWSRLDTLKYYYVALTDHKDKCRWIIPGDDTGAGATDAPKYDDPDIQRKIDEGYELAKKFIKDYEMLFNANIASLNKTQLEEAKTKLEKWQKTRFCTSNGVWKPVIDNFLIEVNNALDLLDDNKNPSPKNPDWQAELAGLKNRASDLGKKIYQNCQPDQNGFTKPVFEELKKLVKLLEEAHGTKTSNTKTELEKFVSDSKNDANKKKALEIAKKVKNQNSDSEDCVATALEKLKTLQEKQLEKARQKLKSLLTGLKIGSKSAYEEIISSIKNSETDINKVIQIWQKCQEADKATNDGQGKLLEALNNLKNDNSNKKAWELVNKYKKNNQSQGYANDMLKKLNGWAEQRKKNYQDIKNAKSKAEFQKAKEEFKKKPVYKNNQKDYDEIYLPLAEAAAEIREKGNNSNSEEKKLAELLTIVMSDYSNWKTQLQDLETKLNEIKTYVQGGKNHNVVKNYSTTQKEALNKLIKKMETKVKEWKTEKIKSEKNSPTQENPPWYKTPWGIIGIFAVIAIIGGAIYYFVKQNVNEED